MYEQEKEIYRFVRSKFFEVHVGSMAIDRRFLFLSLGLAIAAVSPARSQTQISEGVRVMAPIGSAAPGAMQYYVMPQPPISAYIADTKLFAGAADLLKFFQSLPADVQRHGLWITPPGLRENQTQEDRNRFSLLAQEARKQKVLTYVCAAVDAGGPSGLVGWECMQESPSRGSQTLRCIPRDKPNLGHPWWDC